MAQPMCESISTIFSTEEVSRRVEVTRFSTPRRTPWEVAICDGETVVRGGLVLVGGWVGEEGDSLRTPMAVEPSLIASREYSTWKRRPSGEKVLI